MRWIGWIGGLVACESGLSTVLEVEVADPVANGFSSEAPGVLVSDAGHLVQVLGAACGEPIEPFVVSIDHGFGCLEDGQKGSTESVRAWVQPMPDTWDAAALCALGPPGPYPISLSAEITGSGASSTGTTAIDTAAPTTATSAPPTTYGLEGAPASSWAQGETSLEWHKVPICGGVLRGDPAVVAFP